MSVRYTGNGGISPRYECKGRWEHGSRATCTTVPAPKIDQAISTKLIQVMQPAELEIALQVMDKLLVEEDDADRGWKLSLERSKYEVERAERQYQHVEPENRLVARSLEARWNEKLTDLARVQEEFTQYRSRRSWRPTEQDKADIMALSKELPLIWQAATTTAKDRKRILRMLIEDVTVFAEARQADMRLGLRWRNQCFEEIYAVKPLPQATARKHTPQTVDRVRELAAQMTDKQMVVHLNESGWRTPEDRPFTVDGIQWIRYLNHIPGYSPPRQGLTVKEVAARFNVSTHVVYYWLSRGILVAKKPAPGYTWDIPISEPKEEELRKWVQNS
jgi:hypothetical protein